MNDAFTSSRTYLDGVRFVFAEGPFRVQPTDFGRNSDTGLLRTTFNNWTWCKELTQRPGSRCYDDKGPLLGIEQSLDSLAEIIRTEGPFDGVIGFSFGAGVALLLTSMLESGRKGAFEQVGGASDSGFPKTFNPGEVVARTEVTPPQSPFKFAISFSGLAAEHERYRAFYEPKIQTPTLHFITEWDTVVEER